MVDAVKEYAGIDFGAITDDMEAVEAAKAKIMSGELVVFAKGMTKADGTVIDHDLTDAEITGEINYYIKGVELLK